MEASWVVRISRLVHIKVWEGVSGNSTSRPQHSLLQQLNDMVNAYALEGKAEAKPSPLP